MEFSLRGLTDWVVENLETSNFGTLPRTSEGLR